MRTLTQAQIKEIPVRHVRLDPSGENQKLAKQAASSDWAVLQPLEFEFTSCDTTQHNSLVELVFLCLAGKACSMMGGALVPDELHAKVAIEEIACATQLDGLTVVTVNGKEATHDVHMFGANPKWTANLCVWGEGAIVTVRKDSKTGNKGTRMMSVGYAK